MIKINSGNQEDLLLITAIGNGDQQALGKLYDKYAPALTGIISRILQTANAADEVLQKIFQLVWNDSALYNPSTHSPFTWLIKITRQAAIDKAQQVNPAITNSVYRCANGKAESHMPAAEMQMFDLLFYKGLTCAEVATAMKLPGAEIQKQLRMAIKNLAFVKV